MPDQAAITLYADLLQTPVHPERGLLVALPWQTFPGQHEEQQQQNAYVARQIAEAIDHGIDQAGKALVDKATVAQAQKAGSYTIVTLHCASCAGVLATTTLSADGRIAIPPRDIDPSCETRHGAAT